MGTGHPQDGRWMISQKQGFVYFTLLMIVAIAWRHPMQIDIISSTKLLQIISLHIKLKVHRGTTARNKTLYSSRPV